ncbi:MULTISPECIES: ABC transporter ATP-binding protein [Thermomonospora]|uniref:Oligopeptide/dipeptide ABC transporter, ATPase subunit n=1 Tax=Thermomonospora curvata (strain ATCC 19995 / DSM 43183 / JCM 3096 / KCTC 9072 / NBRC 15933 / NCIMB 10081 / Henssen B9) TaxID=471852 RepID=D1A6D5_THECD|nr:MULTISPECIES: ABC transporter ATP-binding protein [Thermomonospora]ACZ00234.1 oligopeptide/dipeptide ABC transporter, ATPase subunit [Thermomonospora curvata DSM 43183]PKK12036.1 MAG: ABC transporter ATP-binding protein [Thermomonospora sp. CIF 1]
MAGSGTAHLRSDRPGRVLVVEDLVVQFPAGRGRTVHAVSGISFDLLDGETLGILGESGCGKSSAGRAVMQLPPPTSGSVRLAGTELTALSGKRLRRHRRTMQMVLQNPVAALNPRRKVADLVAEGPAVWGERVDDARIDAVLQAVGLDPATVRDRRPHQLSGGQCQRVCIARALMMDPKVLICDEPVSSLDVSVQAQILNLLEETKARYGLSMVFIAHDIAVVKNISDRIMVMYLGKICEVVPSGALAGAARHPYTRLLLASVPEVSRTAEPPPPDRRPAELPSPLNPPSGCRFRTRCPLATDRCATEEPRLRQVGDDHYLACHNV